MSERNKYAMLSTWPMAGCRPQRNNLSEFPGPQIGRTAWTYQGIQKRESEWHSRWLRETSPVVGSNGEIAYGTWAGHRAISRDGKLIWEIDGSSHVSNPAFDSEGMLHCIICDASSADRYLVGVISTGCVQYRTRIEIRASSIHKLNNPSIRVDTFSSVLIMDNGRVCIGGGRAGGVLVYDRSGNLRSVGSQGGHSDFESITAVADRLYLIDEEGIMSAYVIGDAENSAELYCLSETSLGWPCDEPLGMIGQPDWYLRTESRAGSGPQIIHERFLVTSAHGYLLLVFDIGKYPLFSPQSAPEGTLESEVGKYEESFCWAIELPNHEMSQGAAQGRHENILLAGKAGTLFSVGLNGKIEWSLDVGRNAGQPIVDLNDVCYIVNEAGIVYCVDPAGQIVWVHDLGERVETICPALGSDKILYVVDVAGNLHAIE